MKRYILLLKKILRLIPEKFSKNIYLIFFCLSISGFMEALGIGLLIPLISEILGNNQNFFFITNIIDLESYNKFETIKFLLIAIFCLYLIKSIYLSKLEFFIQKYVQSVRAELVYNLFSKYTYSNYNFSLNNNSSILLRNLTSEVSHFTAGLLEPFILLGKEFFLISLILLMLFTIDPKVSIFIIIFSIIFILIIKNLAGKVLSRLGKEDQSLKGKENQIILESLQGIKFLKSYNIEKIFNKKLRNILDKFIIVKTNSNAIRLLPRIWIEFILIVFLILLGLIFNLTGLNLINFLTFSSIFIVSMLKVIPSLISCLRVLNTLSNYKASIDLIESEFHNQKSNSSKEQKINFNKIQKKFECKNIFFKFNNSKEILSDLSFSINSKKDIIGIYGDSGSGKTTLVDILIGLLRPDKGNFYIDGNIVEDISSEKIFGYIPQSTFLFDDTIKNNILITKQENRQFSKEEFSEILKLTQIYDFIESLELKENTMIGENGSRLSGGQRQRLGIARALIYEPQILIFDEATSGLDNETETKIFNDLKKISEKNSIIVVSHNENIWKHCTQVYKLQGGKLIKK
tara:strand:+ start:32167 stop:33888 length:1722 start_codon:yes stop_codon:yes gene_type:complete